jgi:malonyl-CoA O-methyltransferase
VDGVEAATEKAGDWLLTQIKDDGRVVTPTKDLWGDIASELIHIYILPPLIESGKLLGKPEYLQAADQALSYYKNQTELVPFNRLSHFHAYCMEALYELGEVDLVRVGMDDVAGYQNRDGAIPAYPDVEWVCSTGMAQYAVIWYQIGEINKANQAIDYLEKLQNESGGFFGSYGNGATYIPGAEISWAVKYFLDACSLKLKCS